MRCRNHARCEITIREYMVLIAASAIALLFDRLTGSPPLSRPLDAIIFRGLSTFVYFMSTLGPAILVLWLCASSCDYRSVARYPGFSACVTSTLVMMLAVGLECFVPVPESSSVFPFFLWLLTGLSIAAVWLWQAWLGCWEPTPCWLDRAGRTLGVLWMVGSVCLCLFHR